MRLYSAARALEDRRAWSDAVALLQEAPKLDPDSIAIARRLSRIYIGALGRPDLASNTASGCLPSIPATPRRCPSWSTIIRKNDPPGAEALLERGSGQPQARRARAGAAAGRFELGELYSGRLHQIDKAADAFAKVIGRAR